MDNSVIFNYIKDLVAHNNREWFKQNRARYDEAWQLFNEIVEQLIVEIGKFDASVSLLSSKDCTYRIYRDMRFTQDKTPYKGHFGAYINEFGKKAFYGGYYVQFDPTQCWIASGVWWLPPKEMRALRQAVADQIDEVERLVDAPAFKAICPTIGQVQMKRMPNGFPKDFRRPDLLMCKDYTCSCVFSSNELKNRDLARFFAEHFQVMKPYNDFLKDNIRINQEELDGLKDIVKIL